MVERPLTPGEVAITRDVFGNNVSTVNVTISDRPASPMFSFTDRPYAPYGNISMVGGWYTDDYSTASSAHRSTFVHEMAHVMQHQKGVNVVAGAVRAFNNYDYSPALSGQKTFSQLNVEQQAAFIEDYYRATIGLAPRHQKTHLTIDQYKKFIPQDYIAKVTTPTFRPDDPLCFLAGTPVSMWPLDVKPGANGKYNQKEVQAKVWEKPIEEITAEDLVVSYDDDGLLIPGRVTQTFENRSKHVLDVPVPQFDEQGKPDGTFKSLMVTPGHVTYCAPVEGEDNPFSGKHVPIMDILRSDGALKMLDGTLVRAATGAVVGSQDDKQFWAHIFERAPDGSTRVREKKLLRLSARWIEPDGTSITMREHMDSIGVELIEEGQFKGYTCLKGKGPVTGFEWKFTPSLPKPEDYILQRSALTLEEVYDADEWEGVRPQMPAPVAGEAGRSFKRDTALYAGGTTAANDHLPPNVPHSMRNSPNQPTMNRQQRRALERKQQKANRVKMRSASKASKRIAATVH